MFKTHYFFRRTFIKKSVDPNGGKYADFQIEVYPMFLATLTKISWWSEVTTMYDHRVVRAPWFGGFLDLSPIRASCGRGAACCRRKTHRRRPRTVEHTTRTC
jgi:hypothetical protein